MPAYQQVSEFNGGRIVAYRKCELRSRKIIRRIAQHPSKVMRICSQLITEGHTEKHVGFQLPPMINAGEQRHIVRSAL